MFFSGPSEFAPSIARRVSPEDGTGIKKTGSDAGLLESRGSDRDQ
jgi:hypothetical protein